MGNRSSMVLSRLIICSLILRRRKMSCWSKIIMWMVIRRWTKEKANLIHTYLGLIYLIRKHLTKVRLLLYKWIRDINLQMYRQLISLRSTFCWASIGKVGWTRHLPRHYTQFRILKLPTRIIQAKKRAWYFLGRSWTRGPSLPWVRKPRQRTRSLCCLTHDSITSIKLRKSQQMRASRPTGTRQSSTRIKAFRNMKKAISQGLNFFPPKWTENPLARPHW